MSSSLSAPDVPKTMGALLIGGFFAAVLSGTVILQTLLYLTTYKSDPAGVKVLVLGVWGLDTLHSAFIWAAMWEYLIGNYGNAVKIDYIPWSISLTVILTAIVTFSVHCFFAHRIFLLSKRNWLMASPVVILALVRLVSASVSTWEMLHYKSFVLFKLHAYWIFTLGLSVSSAVDILITVFLCYLFQSSRPDSGTINYVIDKLMLYAFETGSLTCIGTIASMICWVTMSDNLIFLGLHFVIGKLYANSLLVTLNTRQNIRRAHSTSSGERGPVLFLETRPQQKSSSRNYFAGPSNKGPTELHISVQTSVQYDSESIEAKERRA
ncbi:hypothetical protein B0H17DRAFT_393350 [Mycena rosella]|uniref:DUF6534 domain-containing protein n=1 Tax=Mycena rosella TaxID=1033263 RepID=A0AAD7DRW7_MYCRO|nr:hypothetical protein B0H17DRAFT_393350 [Mycena rosella]